MGKSIGKLIMIEYFIDRQNLPEELEKGIEQLLNKYPISFKKKLHSKEIYFLKNNELFKNGGLKINKKTKKIVVNYSRKIDAFRALGRIFGEKDKITEKTDYVEYPKFDMLGVMLESSRNGVMTVDNVKTFLRCCALMGVNVVMLYTEDTYKVDNEPFFGYLRGSYTKSELQELDDYAYNLGIEMFPCIQTLGHLEQILQWKTYEKVRDISHILLVGEERTYRLLENMISSISSCFRSKRIHIGMDEADGLGTGEYKKRFKEQNTFDIMNEHLTKVCKICKDFGLKPMIWDDMYFRIGSKTHKYYDLDTKIPKSVIKNIPKDVEFVYWDYRHTDYDFYAKFIDLHRKIGKDPIIATGSWNWNRFWSALPFAYSVIEPCIQACKDKNIRQVFITTWGDDGMENDIYSTLPAIQFLAELSYNDSIDKKLLEANFKGICKADLNAYNLASRLDSLPCLKNYKHNYNNTSKWLLWDDLFIGLCEPLQENQSFRKHYRKLAKDLEKLTYSNFFSKRLNFPAAIARVLAIKCDCRKNLVIAYKSKDKKKLAKLLKEEVRLLLKEVKKLHKNHRDMWLRTYKPFGLEVIEIRYGGLIIRIQSLIGRLEQYLNNKINSIPEFETELLKFTESSKDELCCIGSYRRIATTTTNF